MQTSKTLKKVSRFIGNAGGLEKTLRLLQACSQIVAAHSLSVAAAPWLRARSQLALGRRYLRFMKFIDAFALAFEAFEAFSTRRGIAAMLDFAKWNCMGIFLLLESCTILDAMGVYQTKWAPGLFVEAMKFWFYSLTLGILLALMELSDFRQQGPAMHEGTKGGDEKAKQKAAQARDLGEREGRLRKWNIVKKMVIDGCDLSIPGSITGWLTVSSSNVGMLCVLSTVLAGLEIWDKI